MIIYRRRVKLPPEIDPLTAVALVSLTREWMYIVVHQSTPPEPPDSDDYFE